MSNTSRNWGGAFLLRAACALAALATACSAAPAAKPESLVDWHLGVQPSRADVLRRVRAAGSRPNVAWATWLDDGVGAILKRLDELGLAENTKE